MDLRPARPATLAVSPRLLLLPPPPPLPVPVSAALASIAEHGPAVWDDDSDGSPAGRSPLRLAELGSPHSPGAGSSLLVFPWQGEPVPASPPLARQLGPLATLVSLASVDGYAELAASAGRPPRSPLLLTLRRRRARRSPESPPPPPSPLPAWEASSARLGWQPSPTLPRSSAGRGPSRASPTGSLPRDRDADTIWVREVGLSSGSEAVSRNGRGNELLVVDMLYRLVG